MPPKVLLPVRGGGPRYVDLALPDDATVLAPGCVLQPIAIYK